MLKKIILLLTTLLIGIFLIINLSRGVIEAWQSGNRVAIEQKKVDSLKAENQRLKSKIDYLKSDAYVEKEARDKLNLAKPGETVVILPKEQLEKQIAEKQKEKKGPPPPWKQWTFLILGVNL